MMATADFIAFHAAQRPNAVAFINAGREISYAECDRDLRKYISAARQFDLPRTSTVAICCDDFYVHFLLILAFERLGIATASFHANEREYGPLLASARLVIAEPYIAVGKVERLQPVTKEWLTQISALAGDDRPLPTLDAADPVRILRSSGTTGAFKRMLLRRKEFETRLRQYAFKYRFSRDSRYLLTMPFTVGHVVACAASCIRLGATVAAAGIADRADVATAVTSHAITHMTLFPIQLKQVLDSLPHGFKRPPSLMIWAQGASISAALHDRALRLLATEVVQGYGSNEASNLSFTREIRQDGAAVVCPDVQIETVDEGNRPMPQGEIGKIRIRTNSMVDGYIDDPETTRRMFRDGWFYPGDMGVFLGPRQLRIVGRGDDLINLGGSKFSPTDLEDLIQAAVKAADVGVCGMRNADGFDQIYVAVVRSKHPDEELLRLISIELERRQAGDFVVVKLPRIPRNANGKIQRDLLKQMIAAARG